MSARPTWKGVLQISRVTIPIKVFPATEASDKVSFHQLHSQDDLGHPCHARIKQQMVCPSCHRDVPAAEIVKGFEFETGQYVVVNAAELDAIAPRSTRVIELTRFAPAEHLELRTIDRAYFLEADGLADGPADDAYRTLLAAMGGRVGIGTLAIYGREYLVAVGPRDGVLLLYTLHHAAELRSLPSTATSTDRFRPGVVLARRLLAALTRPLDLSDFTDTYQTDVRRLIAAKIAGEEIVVPPLPLPVPVVNLRDALEQSLQAVRATKRLPATATPSAARKRA